MSNQPEKPRRVLYEHDPQNMADNMRRGEKVMAEAKAYLARKKQQRKSK